MKGPRNHDFTGIDLGHEPTVEELWALVERLDADNETQRMRLLEVFDWLETAVDDQVRAERATDECRTALALAQASAEHFEARLIVALAELDRLTDSPVRRALVKVRRLVPTRLVRRG